MLRRAKLARKTAASGNACRPPRRFTSLQPGGSNRELDEHLPSACGNHDRRGTLACGSRFFAFAVARLRRPPPEVPVPPTSTSHKGYLELL